MSVYTSITRDELIAFLDQYAVGTLIDYQGILSGIENTNYFVTTSQGAFVLTLFEQHPAHQLEYFLQLMQFWAERGIPTARPFPTHQGQLLSHLKMKPAALVQRLSGTTIQTPSNQQCYELGQWLARMHLSAQHFPLYRAPDRGHQWRMQTGLALLNDFPKPEREILQAELRYQAQLDWSALPQGTIHADLFRDNALGIDNHLTGIIDLYYACYDAWIYDLAIIINDWCYDNDQLQPQRFSACLKGYQSVRQLIPIERRTIVGAMRAAALRFWLSRTLSQRSPPAGALTFLKDPNEFKIKLLSIIEATPRLEAHWRTL
ncbi:homoserine kinase [Thiofilum flexile]|uniref:homoserine kinase n=1 Tax=Thiofilum flexile TaxID=125627 RepID=UPI00037C910A|nr:homoserine kinase [Thiofilum flexile]